MQTHLKKIITTTDYSFGFMEQPGIQHSKVPDPPVLIWRLQQRGHTRNHLEHGS